MTTATALRAFTWKGVGGTYAKLADGEPLTQKQAMDAAAEGWSGSIVGRPVALGPDRFVITVRNILTVGEKQLEFRGTTPRPADPHTALDAAAQALTDRPLPEPARTLLLVALRAHVDGDTPVLLRALDDLVTETVAVVL